MSDAIAVENLRKTYYSPFARRKSEALKDVSFRVPQGEIFGFLGPNGAGKTTTIRTLMGLVRPTSGKATIFGENVGSRSSRQRIGFLPEHPYFYDYLTVAELCDLAGRLFGMDAAVRKKRAEELISKVGLSRAKNVNLKKYSKGMLQRAGLAQALMNNPRLVVLDEPMSGLDPIGRKEVRDLILELRDGGTTVFFSTHILADVEAIANRLAIVSGGVVKSEGVPKDLIARTTLAIDFTATFRGSPNESAREHVQAASNALQLGDAKPTFVGDNVTFRLPADADVAAVVSVLAQHGGTISSVIPHHESLEDLFLRQTRDGATR